MFGLGAGELLVIFVLALIFIGPKKLPELAKGLGKGIREFQKAKDNIMDDINTPDNEDHLNQPQNKIATNVNDQDSQKGESTDSTDSTDSNKPSPDKINKV